MSLNVELIKSSSYVEAIRTMIISIVLALLTVTIFLLLLRFMGFEIDFNELIHFALTDVVSNSSDLAQILFWSVPLMLTGLSVAIAFQAGLFNIGSQGQMMIGGSFAGIWAANIVPKGLPFLDHAWILIPTTMIVGMIGGGIWAYIPGYLKAEKGAHEVIVTILMNLIAISFVSFLVGSQTYSPFVDKTSLNAYGQTGTISSNAKISLINSDVSSFLDYTIIVAVLAIVILQFMLYKSNFGFKIRAVGLNSVASEITGINSKRITKRAMFISGAVAGLGGSLLVQGDIRYSIGMESTFGFDGIAVALIGQNIPFGVGLAAILFGFLHQSRVNLGENTNIPPEIIIALQAWIIFFIAAPMIAKKLFTASQNIKSKNKNVETINDDSQIDNEKPSEKEDK